MTTGTRPSAQKQRLFRRFRRAGLYGLGRTHNVFSIWRRRHYGGVFEGRIGRHIDIGAGHPTQGSNTYGLYLRGWRGLLVEPLARFQPDIQRLRPEDSLRQALVGESPGANGKIFRVQNLAVLYGVQIAGRRISSPTNSSDGVIRCARAVSR